MSWDREEQNALEYIFNSLLALCGRAKTDIAVTQISLLSFTLSSLPHKATLSASIQACHSAVLGEGMLAGTKQDWGPQLSMGHMSHVMAGDLG